MTDRRNFLKMMALSEEHHRNRIVGFYPIAAEK